MRYTVKTQKAGKYGAVHYRKIDRRAERYEKAARAYRTVCAFGQSHDLIMGTIAAIVFTAAMLAVGYVEKSL